MLVIIKSDAVYMTFKCLNDYNCLEEHDVKTDT